jgi:hypothetical protein
MRVVFPTMSYDLPQARAINGKSVSSHRLRSVCRMSRRRLPLPPTTLPSIEASSDLSPYARGPFSGQPLLGHVLYATSGKTPPKRSVRLHYHDLSVGARDTSSSHVLSETPSPRHRTTSSRLVHCIRCEAPRTKTPVGAVARHQNLRTVNFQVRRYARLA